MLSCREKEEDPELRVRNGGKSHARGLIALKVVLETMCKTTFRDEHSVDEAMYLMTQNAVDSGIVNYVSDPAVATLIADVFMLGSVCQAKSVKSDSLLFSTKLFKR